MNTVERVALLEKLLDRVKSRPGRRKLDVAATAEPLPAGTSAPAAHTSDVARSPQAIAVAAPRLLEPEPMRTEPPPSDVKSTLLSTGATRAAVRAARAQEPVRVITADEIPPAEPSVEASLSALAAAGFLEGPHDALGARREPLQVKFERTSAEPAASAAPLAAGAEPTASAAPTLEVPDKAEPPTEAIPATETAEPVAAAAPAEAVLDEPTAQAGPTPEPAAPAVEAASPGAPERALGPALEAPAVVEQPAVPALSPTPAAPEPEPRPTPAAPELHTAIGKPFAPPAATPVAKAADATAATPEPRAAETKSALELLAEVKASKQAPAPARTPPALGAKAPPPLGKPEEKRAGAAFAKLALDLGGAPKTSTPLALEGDDWEPHEAPAALPKPAAKAPEPPKPFAPFEARQTPPTGGAPGAAPLPHPPPPRPPLPSRPDAQDTGRRSTPPPLPRAEPSGEGRRSAPPPLPFAVAGQPPAAARSDETGDESDEPTAIHSREHFGAELAKLHGLAPAHADHVEDETTTETAADRERAAAPPAPERAPASKPTPAASTALEAPEAPATREAAPEPITRVAELVAEPPPAPAPALAARPETVTVRPELLKPVIVASGRVGEFIGEVEQPAPSRFGDLLDATLGLGFG